MIRPARRALWWTQSLNQCLAWLFPDVALFLNLTLFFQEFWGRGKSPPLWFSWWQPSFFVCLGAGSTFAPFTWIAWQSANGEAVVACGEPLRLTDFFLHKQPCYSQCVFIWLEFLLTSSMFLSASFILSHTWVKPAFSLSGKNTLALCALSRLFAFSVHLPQNLMRDTRLKKHESKHLKYQIEAVCWTK